MLLSETWFNALMSLAVVCALAVLVLSHWRGEEWRYILAMAAPVAGYLFSRDDDVGVVVLAGWALAVLVAMVVVPRLLRGRQPRRRKPKRNSEAKATSQSHN